MAASSAVSFGALLLRGRELRQIANVEVVFVARIEAMAIAQDCCDLDLSSCRFVGRDRADHDDSGNILLESSLNLILKGRNGM
jgi:hypothetical protein